MTAAIANLETVTSSERASALLDPIRRRLLVLAREPRSAASLAAELGLKRQRVNYHVQELRSRGLLRLVEERPKGNMRERLYQATARSYLLSPDLLGPLEPAEGPAPDRVSAAYLLFLAAQLQRELGQAAREARVQHRKLATLSATSEFRFATAQAREAFATDLQAAVVDVVRRHTEPITTGSGRPHRLVVGCYPIPPSET